MSCASQDSSQCKQPGERRRQRQQQKEPAIRGAGLDRCDRERAQDADADKGGDAGDPGGDNDAEAAAPRPDDRHQRPQGGAPADLRRGAGHRVGRGLAGNLDDFARCLAGCSRRLVEQREISLALLGLRSHQPPVGAVAADQLGVPSGFDDPAVIQHQDAVGADDARQPMRQDQRGAAGREAVDRLLDHRLVLGVDRRQRLVEDQDRRVAEQGAGDRQTLALAARQA